MHAKCNWVEDILWGWDRGRFELETNKRANYRTCMEEKGIKVEKKRMTSEKAGKRALASAWEDEIQWI